MTILHGGMLDGQFWVWGEAEPAGKQRRKPRAHIPGAPPPAHPFAPSRATLLVELCARLPGFTAGPYAKRLVAWLPTAGGLPLLSTAAPADDAGQAITLQPWLVGAIALEPSVLLTLLRHLITGEAIAHDYQPGADLDMWTAVFRLALTLVARQRFLPDVQPRGHLFDARWTAVCAGRDAQALGALAAALPGVGRALSHSSAAPPTEPAGGVLATFMDLVVDALVRAAGPVTLVEETVDPFLRRLGLFIAPPLHLHDRWLTALGAAQGRIGGAQAELPAFAAQVRAWRRRTLASVLVPFRFCVRLEEPLDADIDPTVPDASTHPWRLRFLLQSQDDPSLLIDAAEIWRAEDPGQMPPGVTKLDLRRTLLTGLGKFAQYDAGLAAALREQQPAGLDLDLPGAFRFLTETAARLEHAGCVVLLPKWWTRSRRKVKLRASIRSPKMLEGGLRSRPLITFDWKVAVGNVEMTQEELQALARLKAPLVQVRGRWVQVSADEIQAALDFWKKQGKRQVTLGDAARLALDETRRVGDLEVERVEIDGWLAESFDRLRRGQAALEIIPPPEGLRATLRPYQQRGYAWLRFLAQWGLGACLADDMGLGKTLMTLALIQRDWDAEGHAPVLVICPTSVVGNWKREAARFTPELPVLVHHGGTRRKDDSFVEEAQRHAIVISSYALLHRDRDLFKQVPWRGIVLDEAQNIKNAETKQAQAAASIPGGYRIALTGTPVENSVADLWSLMDFLNPGLLGTAKDFKDSFFIPIQSRRDSDATARLKRLTGPFLLRRVKSDPAIISDLPEKLEMDVFCTLTKEQASLYEAVVRDMEQRIDEVEGMARRGLIFATLTRLKQVCNHPAHFLSDGTPLAGRSGKLARLEEMLEEALAEGDHALIFTQFAEMGALLQPYLAQALGDEVLFLSGQTPKPQRDQMIERFQSADGPPIFILSLKAGGLGLNLTRANRVFHFDRWWNPAVENQATDRAFRIGQQRAVQVHKFVCAGTLEERIAELIASKQEIAAHVIGSGEGWLTELSTAQLREIFALRADAVEG